MYRIKITPHSDRELAYKLAGQVPLEVRNAFRDMVRETCTWHHSTKSYVGDLDKLPSIVDAICNGAGGFVLDAGGDLYGALVARIEDIHATARKIGASLEGSKLFPYQREGVSYLAGRKAAGLFDEMGLGKTVQAIMAIPAWHNAPCAPAVIVCPASVKGVWRAELKKWRPAIKDIYLVSGRGNWIPPQPGEIVICNYEILPDAEELKELREQGYLVPGTVLIADEVHAAKNPNARRTKLFRNLREVILDNAGAVYGLTGTPLLNNGKELKEVTKSLGLFKEAFGNERSFSELFEHYWTDTGRKVIDYFAPRPKLAEHLAKVSLRRHRKDVMQELPDKMYSDFIEADPPTGEAAAICDRALEDPMVLEALELLTEGEAFISGMGALATARRALATCKIPKLLQVIEDEYEANAEPLIVFSAHRPAIDVLAKRPGWATITGSTSQKKRAEIQDDFQKGKYKGIAGTIRAMSEGLTLTHASHVLFVDLDWTPARNNQAEDRACRIGQKNSVMIRHMVANHPLDEMIMETLVRKQIAFDKSVNALPTYNQEIACVTGDNSELLKTADALQTVADLLGAHVAA